MLPESKKERGFSRKYLIGIIAILIVVAAVASYVFLMKPSGQQTIKIGLLFSYSGVMADVGKTQRDGAILAIEEVNAAGGLNMPWGKVKVSYISRDDETNVDVATRRFWELVDTEKVVAVVGTCWGPIALSLNEQSKKAKVIYALAAAPQIAYMKKDARSPYLISVMPYSYTIGYSAAAYCIKQGWKRIYFLARSDVWGWDMRDGVNAAIKDLGGELAGYDEVPLGTPDFSSVLIKVQQAKPDVFIFAQFAADQVNVLKQAHAMDLKSVTRIFPAWITNAVASAVPPEVLNGTYALHYLYWNMTGFPVQSVVDTVHDYVNRYINMWGYPPDSYATSAYIVTKETLRAIEVAGSTNADDIIKVFESKSPNFTAPKGPGTWRISHDVIWTYAFFVVKGKDPSRRSGLYDLYDVIGYYGGAEIMPPLSMLGYAA